ncbi:transglutaminaseTgpA domain-containing protein [Actinoplanes sp. NPDC051851]|uniref:DUF3488 and transglutaminase-like domain-containing protein n=1 Tax=Actinoplanes sp. NPDC051851 TaxID=3154753 RepID=UPI0034238DE5
MVKFLKGAIVPLALIGMLALSGVVLGRIYADDLLVRLVAGAALGSIGSGLATRRLPPWTAAPVSVLLLAVWTVVSLTLAAAQAGLTDPFPTLVRDALVNGIPRLLTALIPVEATPDTVVVPVIATWLAGLAAAEVGVRARRVLLGMVTPVALYAGALYVVGPNADAAVGPTLAFAALAAIALFRVQAPADMPAAIRTRAVGGAAAGLVVLIGLVAVAGPWISGQVSVSPADPRRYVEPPQVDSLDESPLNRISGWMLAPKQELFAVSGDIGKSARIRLAVLSDYDGVTWKVGATYRNAGRVLPAQADLPGAEITDVEQTITVSGLTGRLMPAMATPSAVSGARVAYDATTGTLIRPEGLTGGLTYTVTSRVQQPDLNELPTADVPSGEAVARYLSFGTGVPDSIQRLADHLADGNGAPYDRAAAIEDFLAEHYKETADAPSGHAYPNLAYFLFGPRGQGGQEGTSEQFAASFALLARLTGLPSRIVVGFTAPSGGGEVTGGDAIAWPEVYFDDLGWLPFDPMPKSDDPTPVEEDFTPKPTTPPTTPPDSSTPSTDPAPSASAVAAAPATGGGASTLVVASGASGSLLLVLVGAAFAVVQLRASLRRRRLFSGTVDDRITGAWREFTDALRLAGQPVPSHMSATEMASYAADVPVLRPAAPTPADDLPPLDGLVDAVNTVGFAPGAAAPEQAEKAGAQVVAYAAALKERRSWWRRLWWSIHPGPLRWHR